MILQSKNPIRMVRELRGAPISILLVLGFNLQPVSNEYLEGSTGYTDKPVRKALRYLEDVGLVVHTHIGWKLNIKKSKQLPFTLELEEEIEPSDPKSEGEETDNPGTILEKNHKNVCPDQPKTAVIQIEGEEIGRNKSDTVNYLSKSVSSRNININKSTSNYLNLTAESGESPPSEEIQQVLDAAEILFGNRILGEPQEYADIDRLLAWIAKAYDGFRRSGKYKVSNPAGLVYWAFHKGSDSQLEKKYLDFNHYDRLSCADSNFQKFMDQSGQWKDEE